MVCAFVSRLAKLADTIMLMLYRDTPGYLILTTVRWQLIVFDYPASSSSSFRALSGCTPVLFTLISSYLSSQFSNDIGPDVFSQPLLLYF